MLTLVAVVRKRWLAVLWLTSLIIGVASLAVALNDVGFKNLTTFFRMQAFSTGRWGTSNSGTSSQYVITEGERFGSVALGMSLDDVRRQLGKPFSSASRLSDEATRYDWNNGDDSSWGVFVDTKTEKVIAVMYLPPIDFGTYILVMSGQNRGQVEAKLNTVQFETRKGARYGNSLETIAAIYGKPEQVFFKPGLGTFTYYYPAIRTEFLFNCLTKWDTKNPCPEYSEVVEQIRIYSVGWPPVRIWGSDYGHR